MKSREERIKKAYSLEFYKCKPNDPFKMPEYIANGTLGIPEEFSPSQEILDSKLRDDLVGYICDLPYGAVTGDITCESVLKNNRPVYGVIKAKEDGILAGIEEVTEFYARNSVQVKPFKKDGKAVKKGDIIAEIYANEKEFLKVERTGLNVLQRMSGIATATKKLADIVAPYKVKIVGTRKTLLNYLDKKSIYMGGGLPHRAGLYDAILIKDNHLEAIREEGIENVIETALERAYWSKYRNHARFIEIEVSTIKDAVKAAGKWKGLYEKARDTSIPFIIMLDNMKPMKIKKIVYQLKKKGLYDYILLEASGKITEKNILEYASTEVDAISIGALTHSVKALDISQKIVRSPKDEN